MRRYLFTLANSLLRYVAFTKTALETFTEDNYPMPDQLKWTIQGARLDPTTIQRVEARDTEVAVTIPEIVIGEIRGNVTLRSRLENGRLRITFSPYFDWGINRSQSLAAENHFRQQLMDDCGLDESQADCVIRLIDTETPPPDPRHASVRSLTDLPGWTIQNDQHRVTPPPLDEVRDVVINIPLPDVNVNLDPEIALTNLTLRDIRLNQRTTVTTDPLTLAGTSIDDFEVNSSMSAAARFDRAEVTNFGLMPKQLPQFVLNNLQTALSVPELTANEIPITISAREGLSDLYVKVAEWKPRWRWEISVKVLWKRITIFIEFGFNIKIEIFYTWIIRTLAVAIMIRNLVVRTMSVSLRIARLAFTNISIGLLRMTRLLGERIP